MHELLPNTKLSHYRIVSKIGEGGMGEVYLAEDTQLERKVAIKFLAEEFSRDEDRLRRFTQEAKAASALNHPNILTIHEIGEADGTRFIAFEFISGETLRDRIGRESLDVRKSLEIAIQIASALQAAHASGIIHRDIKPDNVMLRDDDLVKVLDFGLAKLNERPTSDLERPTLAQINTRSGTILGTAAYMSPEQTRGKKADGRSDIWSLGVVLYEMLTNRRPFVGETEGDTIASILKTEAPLPTRFNPDIPAELERIATKALRKNVDERYQTANDLLIDLKSLKRHLDFAAELERTASTSENEVLETPLTNAATPDATRIISRAESRSNRWGNGRNGIAVALAVILLAAIGFGYWYYNTHNTKQIESIAVMPFINESGNTDVEYLSDGITETLISKLSQLPNLKVKARASVFHYKGTNTDPRTVGRELAVQAVLNGRVVSRGDNLTLLLELVDPVTGNRIWGEQYNRKQTDLVVMQNDIALDVSQKLKSKLSGADEAKLAKSETSDNEAYQLYLKGRFHLNQLTDDGFFKARDYFQQAIDRDPRYALAYAGLADAYQTLSGWNAISAMEGMPKADAAARKAIELDDSLVEGHATFGIVRLFYDWDWQSAESEFKRAVALNPNYADAHKFYAYYLSSMRRFDEAHVEMRRAHEFDPLSIDKFGGDIYYFQRDYDRAIVEFRKALDLDPNSGYAHWALGNVLAQKGMYTEAIEEYKKSIPLSGESPDEPAMLAWTYAKSGKTKEARKILGELNERSRQRYISPTSIAFIHIALGEKDEAFALLDRAVAERDTLLVLLGVEPFFDPLRGDPRFQDLLRRVGLPQ